MQQNICYPCLKPQNQHYFDNAQQAITGTLDFRQHLYTIAQNKKLRSEPVEDQSYPNEVIVLRPKQTQAPALLLLGGMGPLAGLGAFEVACQMFQNSREIVLFQACSLPNRTTAIQQKTQIGASQEPDLAMMLAIAIREAMQYICSRVEPVELIVLCNGAHYFLPEVMQQLLLNYSKIFFRLQWISLIDTTIQHLQQRNFCQPLILCTTATRLGCVYSRPLQKVGIVYLEPNDELQSILMQSIYQGVKTSDYNFACKVGEHFFVELLQLQPNVDCIITGCSEIPYLLEWLKNNSSKQVKGFLSKVEIIDPVTLTLNSRLKSLQHLRTVSH
ncbi:MAG: aspartate/glutamate racemase family protein [Nostoc sp.]|uniref:aspartate/glutamate racemase family protein n=1 Tax=Nostoc sp. TaxID=1180 RepID=UPI002FF7B417